VDSTDIQPKGADPFGEISYASLVLRAPLVCLGYRLGMRIKSDDESNLWRALTSNDGVITGILCPDVIDELQDEDQVFCMRSEPFRA
jgi:hypothetical protein